jgi:RNA polymerase sigma-70 factor (ECF subfamily)
MPDFQQHRHQQFLRAFLTHEAAVRAFVRRLVPSRADADDVLQEVAIVLWEKFDEFRDDGDFKAWACGVARFKVLAWLRDKGRDRLMLDTDVVELIAEDSLQAEPRLQRRREALEACLEKVSPAERDLLARAYQPAAKIQEVAATSGRSVGGFYQWLYRMRQILLECVQRQMGLDSPSRGEIL